MSRAWMWFLLSCKRYAKRVSFLVILLILPLAVTGIRTAEERGRTEVRIAVYAQGGEAAAELPLEQALAQRLVSGTPGRDDDGGLLQFYLCESGQQVEDEVASKRAECGYVIEQGLRERLEKKDFKRCIRVYSAPSTVAAGLSTEVVFAALMELYDKELLAGCVKNGAFFDEAAPAGSAQRDAMAEQAGELYEKWLYNGSTFHFTAESAGAEVSGTAKDGAGISGAAEADAGRTGESAGEAAGKADAVFPVRGIVAVYVFIIGLYAAVMNLTDEKKGLFLPVPYNCRTACRISAMAAPVFLAAVSGTAALWSGGAWSGFLRELPSMVLYLAAVTAFSWLLRVVFKSPEAICCLIPLFLIGSLIFCPVFIDARRYLPAVGYVQKLFLPWYYLNWFG